MTPEAKALFDEHTRLSHALQSGIKFQQDLGLDAGDSPKHLRTGINVAMCDIGALVNLLVEMEIITSEQYFRAACEVLRRDKVRIEDQLSKKLGREITLE